MLLSLIADSYGGATLPNMWPKLTLCRRLYKAELQNIPK